MGESYSDAASRGPDAARAESVLAARHAMNDAVTALLAEAQLLELEPLAEDHLHAVARIVDLARRVAKVARRLDESGR